MIDTKRNTYTGSSCCLRPVLQNKHLQSKHNSDARGCIVPAKRLVGDTAVGRHLRASADNLASSELGHAGVIAVVHVVIYNFAVSQRQWTEFKYVRTDGINSTARASVAASRAAGSRGGLGRGVIDRVARRSATTLESVVELDDRRSKKAEPLSVDVRYVPQPSGQPHG
jgi:hypothetical protein